MDLSYGALHNTTSDRLLEGLIEGARGTIKSAKHQVEWGGCGTAIVFLPVLERVSPETPKFRSVGCDLEPVVANEEEIVRALPKALEVRRPNEDSGEYVTKDFGRHAGGYVQQRVSVTLELDHVPVALFDPLLQGPIAPPIGAVLVDPDAYGPDGSSWPNDLAPSRPN